MHREFILENFYLLLDKYRPCKYHGTALFLPKIPSFKYFRGSSLLKSVERAHLRFCCKVLTIVAPNYLNP